MGLGSRWFDVGRPDHLGPLIGFVGDEFAEAGRRQRKHRATEVGDPRLADARLLDRKVQSSKMVQAALLLLMLEAAISDLVSPSA
jgi:hypothetical protein